MALNFQVFSGLAKSSRSLYNGLQRNQQIQMLTELFYKMKTKDIFCSFLSTFNHSIVQRNF